MLRTADPCYWESQLGRHAPEWILGNIIILKTLIFKQGYQCLTFLLFISLRLWVRRSLLGSGVTDSRSRFSAVGERGWSTALISSLLANSVCSRLTTHTINKGAFRDCWVMCHWVGDRPRAGDEGPASHPLRPCWWDLSPIPHSSRCPRKLSSVISCHCQSGKIYTTLCVARNSLTLTTPGDGWGQTRAVCCLLEQVFRFPSDRQKPSIFSLTNWQYVPGWGVGNRRCFSSFQIMCWTLHSKVHTSGTAKTSFLPSAY